MPITIVGIDGSQASRAALALATTLAEASDASILAAAVYRREPRQLGPGGSPGYSLQGEQRAREEAERLLAETVPDGVARKVVGAGSASEGLHRLAEEEQAALIAVGSTHHGRLGRIVPGSVGDNLLHGAPCPVAVVPADRGDTLVRSIGVAFDDREESAVALRAARSFAERIGGRLTVLAVQERASPVSPAELGLRGPADPEGRRRERLERWLAEITQDLPAELAGEHRVLAGRPGPALVEACRHGIDLLVAGSRGYGPPRSVLVGSVSGHLVDHASCPVVVVPRHAPAGEP